MYIFPFHLILKLPPTGDWDLIERSVVKKIGDVKSGLRVVYATGYPRVSFRASLFLSMWC